ncbi:MAG: hypothetical protein CMP77_08710 [Flavobacterium sp.]|nr:hypothetical protein [Flavobacterium sp.]
MFLFLSCKSSKSEPCQECFEIFKKEVYDNYVVYFANKENDTLSFIADINSLKGCKSNFTKIDKKLLNPVYDLMDRSNHKYIVTSQGDTLNFIFRLWDANHMFQVTVSDSAHNKSYRKEIFTYDNLPYFIDECKALK